MRDKSNTSVAKSFEGIKSSFDEGAFDQAEQGCGELLDLDEAFAPAWHLRGLICLQRKQVGMALEFLAKAAAIDPQSAPYLRDLGAAQYQSGLIDPAIASLEKSHAIAPDPETRVDLREARLLRYLQIDRDKPERETTVDKIHIGRHASPKVVIYSWNHISNNFGDRLPHHLVAPLFPADWELHFAAITPYDFFDLKSYDLVILGLGNSLFHRVLQQPRFLDFFTTAPKLVGLFGTQYRSLINTQILGALIDKMDLWFARYRDDIELYGSGRSNVSHLGDWLISLFPTTRWTQDTTITLQKDQICNDQIPLDRLMQYIQRGRRVFSPRIHTLLCALCSAEYVSYHEQRNFEISGRPLASGKFASLCLDIFEKEYPEDTWFEVERDKVIAYKAMVQQNIIDMRKKILELMG